MPHPSDLQGCAHPEIAAPPAAVELPEAWRPECEASASVFDVVADADGAAMLLPLSGGEARPLSTASEEEILTIRVFRFFEDRADEARIWERELRNVNSGSLLWLVVHLQPRMHSVSGAKYGRWFVAHHVRVRARHLRAGYFMFEDGGACPLARTFGTTGAAVKALVSGEKLETGYFWFASPDRCGSGASHKDVTDDDCMAKHGWQHAGMQGLFSGDAFLASWSRLGSKVDERSMQQVLLATAPESR